MEKKSDGNNDRTCSQDPYVWIFEISGIKSTDCTKQHAEKDTDRGTGNSNNDHLAPRDNRQIRDIYNMKRFRIDVKAGCEFRCDQG